MRYVPAFCLLLLFSHSAAGQVLPTSNGSCSVSPSGLQSCDWVTGVSLRKANSSKPIDANDDIDSGLFVTRFVFNTGTRRTVECAN
jgi:hypothetical protein